MSRQISKSNNKKQRYVQVAAIVAIVTAAIWCWEDLIEDRIFPKRFGVVKDGQIYRSGQISATLIEGVLRKYDIRVIIDLNNNSPKNNDQREEKKAAAEFGVVRYNFPLKGDGTGDINNYAQAIAAIMHAQQEHMPVLVHCAAGTQRTGGVIAAYRLLVEKKQPSFVLNELMKYGWNPRDDRKVIDYLYENMIQLVKKLRELGITNEFPEYCNTHFSEIQEFRKTPQVSSQAEVECKCNDIPIGFIKWFNITETVLQN